MEIRSLTIQDFEALLNLWQRAGLSIRPKGRDRYEAIAREMQANPDGFIGLFDGDRLIGFSLATYDGRKAWINRVAIDPDYRRRGLAHKMIKESEQRLNERGTFIIAVLIEDDNEASLELFQKEGYVLHKDIFYLTKRESADV